MDLKLSDLGWKARDPCPLAHDIMITVNQHFAWDYISRISHSGSILTCLYKKRPLLPQKMAKMQHFLAAKLS